MEKNKVEMYEEWLDNIREDPSNPNKMTEQQIKALANSMTKYGLIVPIIINQDNIIIDGHQRKIAAERLGLKKHPTIKINTNEFDQKLLKQILNKLKGSHDPEKDMDEFRELAKTDDLLDSLKEYVAMDDEQIKEILWNLNPKDEHTEEQLDATPDVETIKTSVKVGDVYQLGRHLVICGDCLSSDLYKTHLKGNKADLIFTDPPYNVAYNQDKSPLGKPSVSKGTIENDNMGSEEFKSFLKKAVGNMFEFSKEGSREYV